MNQDESQPRSPDNLPPWEIVALATGDTLSILVFAVLGQVSHHIETVQGPFLAAANTCMPFVVAWVVLGAILGAYSGRAMYPLRRVIWRVLRAGLIALPVGAILWAAARSAPELRRFSLQPAFVGVATGSISLLLIIWRAIWSRVRRLWWPELP